MGAGYHGGFGNTKGSKKQDKRESNSQSLPKNDAQINIFFLGKKDIWRIRHLIESYLLIWQIIKKNLLVLINTEIHGMLK